MMGVIIELARLVEVIFELVSCTLAINLGPPILASTSKFQLKYISLSHPALLHFNYTFMESYLDNWTKKVFFF